MNLYGSMSKDLYNHRNELITTIAKNNIQRLYSQELDDLIQMLWVKVLQCDKKYDKFIEDGLLITVCKRWILTLIRDDSKKNTYSLDCLMEDTGFDVEEPLFLADTVEYRFELNNLYSFYNKFKKDSLEQKYLKFYFEASGICDFGIHPRAFQPDGKHAKNRGYTKENLAKYLGLSSSSPNFRDFIDKMNILVKEACAE